MAAQPVFEDPSSRWKQRITALLAAVLFFTAAFALSAAFAWLLRSPSSTSAPPLARNAVALFLGAGLATALLLRVPPPRRWSALGLGADFAQPLLLGLALGAGSCALVAAALQAGGWAAWTAIDPAAVRFDWRGSAGVGLLLLAAGAAGEELFVRGYLLQQLGRALTPWAAVAATSAAFALLHAPNPGASWLSALNTALYGGVFGLAVLWRRSLWLSIGIHYSWNCAEALLGANVSGLTIRLTELNLEPTGPAWLTGGAYGPEAGAAGTVGAALIAFVLRRLPRRGEQPALLWHIETQNSG